MPRQESILRANSKPYNAHHSGAKKRVVFAAEPKAEDKLELAQSEFEELLKALRKLDALELWYWWRQRFYRDCEYDTLLAFLKHRKHGVGRFRKYGGQIMRALAWIQAEIDCGVMEGPVDGQQLYVGNVDEDALVAALKVCRRQRRPRAQVDPQAPNFSSHAQQQDESMFKTSSSKPTSGIKLRLPSLAARQRSSSKHAAADEELAAMFNVLSVAQTPSNRPQPQPTVGKQSEIADHRDEAQLLLEDIFDSFTMTENNSVPSAPRLAPISLPLSDFDSVPIHRPPPAAVVVPTIPPSTAPIPIVITRVEPVPVASSSQTKAASPPPPYTMAHPAKSPPTNGIAETPVKSHLHSASTGKGKEIPAQAVDTETYSPLNPDLGLNRASQWTISPSIPIVHQSQLTRDVSMPEISATSWPTQQVPSIPPVEQPSPFQPPPTSVDTTMTPVPALLPTPTPNPIYPVPVFPAPQPPSINLAPPFSFPIMSSPDLTPALQIPAWPPVVASQLYSRPVNLYPVETLSKPSLLYGPNGLQLGLGDGSSSASGFVKPVPPYSVGCSPGCSHRRKPKARVHPYNREQELAKQESETQALLEMQSIGRKVGIWSCVSSALGERRRMRTGSGNTNSESSGSQLSSPASSISSLPSVSSSPSVSSRQQARHEARPHPYTRQSTSPSPRHLSSIASPPFGFTSILGLFQRLGSR
ncbi:hypothetical protein MIND_00591100 [Mycena indigotica]|uniref:Uncharacterized protein n=1 Tax=Mycena indigotica TaxID=2126181 RepID=A0A8H6W6P0_9AGAR|nr:uncharacterized protein MIND_00591100 [Mycena indigotica]KAF7303618.1 hypothetical protein MIND_00591100 [Mycena indigotica]